jgi:alginate O-acetyltransferase complex protein AlgI
MLFNSYAFLFVFLPIAIAAYAIADPYPKARMPVLIALSLAFYSYWDIRFLPIMIFSILGNWLLIRVFVATKIGAILTAAIVLDLLSLGVFKYTDFFADTAATLIGRPLPHLSLVLPLGISFFTFHHIMYLADLKRGAAPIFPLDRYALYICFFPQAISGPIARWSEVMHQFGHRAFGPGWQQRCAIGLVFIVVGLLQKTVLADPLSRILDPIYAEALAGPVHGNCWLALAFALQIFFDFSGYSDIAIGLALVFGIELPRNFEAPLRATSIQLFWRRWHMTLSRFLRDYLYIPLGGNRHGLGRQLAAMFVTMTLGGLWHGAGWTFVLWGMLHGSALGVATLWRKYLPAPPALVGWLFTFIFVVLTFVLFRAGSLQATWHILAGLVDHPLDTHPLGRNLIIAALVAALVLPPTHVIARWLTETPRTSVAVGLAIALCVVFVALGDHENYNFIYFQF